MPEFDVRLVTGDIDPVLEHQTPRHGDRLILDVVLCNDSGKKVVANGTPEDFRIIGRQLIEIADTAEPPTVASTEADYDAAEARYAAKRYCLACRRDVTPERCRCGTDHCPACRNFIPQIEMDPQPVPGQPTIEVDADWFNAAMKRGVPWPEVSVVPNRFQP